MMKFFICLILCIFYLLYPFVTYADKIKGDFNRLPLMRDEASKDKNERAIYNIDYIKDTANGNLFEVDNENPPIEAIVYKLDRTRQFKPLRERMDEDLIVFYFYKVDKFAKSYYSIVDEVVGKRIKPEQAKASFQDLLQGYPEFSAAYRALGVTSLTAGHIDLAIGTAESAVSANKYDPKAFWLLSICKYAAGHKRGSFKSYEKAITMYPDITLGFWEQDYIKINKPEIYHKWLEDIEMHK